MAKKPHHMHALTKASAKHLHAMGHIPAAHRDKIIKSADRGMKAAKGSFEGSPQDNRLDAAGAKKAGMSKAAFEGSPADQKMDAAGQRRMRGAPPAPALSMMPGMSDMDGDE